METGSLHSNVTPILLILFMQASRKSGKVQMPVFHGQQHHQTILVGIPILMNLKLPPRIVVIYTP